MAQIGPQLRLSSISSSFVNGGGGEDRRSLSTFLSLKPPSNLNSAKPRSVCKASWQELAGVLVFSAIPFTVVKAIAYSPLGESLQRQLLEKKKEAVQNSSKFRALADKARNER
ncbi:hypothetical protein QQP08_018136 [Theobroma cacao]|nr:hypothetical protein QQP08_018136 [Theobroma cacao]